MGYFLEIDGRAVRQRMSRRQRKRAQVAARRRRDIRWLAEHPEAFGIESAHVVAECRDFGASLRVSVTRSDGARAGCWIEERAFGRRTHRGPLARRYGTVFNNWLAEAAPRGQPVAYEGLRRPARARG